MDRQYTTGYGEPIDVGQHFLLRGKMYKIEKLEVIRYAGLIASYVDTDGAMRKTNLSDWTLDKEKNLWVPRTK